MGDRGSWLGPPEASFVAAAGGLVDGMTSTLDSKLDGVGLSLVLDSAKAQRSSQNTMRSGSLHGPQRPQML